MSGNFVVDVSTGIVQSAALQYLGTTPSAFSLDSGSQTSSNNGTQTFFDATDASAAYLSLDFAVTSLVGYTGP